MSKAELSKLLEEKVQEKVKEGFSIPTYALDAASRDRVKRALHGVWGAMEPKTNVSPTNAFRCLLPRRPSRQNSCACRPPG